MKRRCNGAEGEGQDGSRCQAVPVAVDGGRRPPGPGHVAALMLCSLGSVAVLEGRVLEFSERSQVGIQEVTPISSPSVSLHPHQLFHGLSFLLM